MCVHNPPSPKHLSPRAASSCSPHGQTKMLLDGATCTLHKWHMASTFHMQIQLAYHMQSSTLAELGNLAGSYSCLMLLKHPHSGISVKCGSLFSLEVFLHFGSSRSQNQKPNLFLLLRIKALDWEAATVGVGCNPLIASLDAFYARWKCTRGLHQGAGRVPAWRAPYLPPPRSVRGLVGPRRQSPIWMTLCTTDGQPGAW